MERIPESPRHLHFLPTIVAFLGAVLLAGPAVAQGRFPVIVPDLSNSAGQKGNFGKDVAKEIKKLLEDYPTHEPADENELKKALARFDIKEEALSQPDCIAARQLTTQTSARLVLCGVWREVSRTDYVVSAKVIPVGADPFEIPEFHATDAKDAAQKILTSFGRFVDGLLAATYCQEKIGMENWAGALTDCAAALEANPLSAGAAYNLASARWKSGDHEGAAVMFRKVLEIDPVNYDAMLALGILAAEDGDTGEATRYFREYLTFNPGNALVRLQIATEAAQAGGYEAALQIVEEGMPETTGDELIQLKEFAGAIAMNAAIKHMADAGDPGNLGDARPIVERGLRYLEDVHAAKGADMDVTGLRNMLTAYRLLEQNDRAVEFGRQAVQTHPDDPTLWSNLADALNRAGLRQEAMDALDRAASIDPAFAILARKASWLADTDDHRAAVNAIMAGVERGEITAQNGELLAQKVAVAGFKKAQAGQHEAALPYYDSAEKAVSTAPARGMIAFFRGYSVYSLAVQREKPETVETATATLPQFRRAVELMQQAAAYTATNPNLEKNRTEIIAKAGEYITIQEAIIKRGR